MNDATLAQGNQVIGLILQKKVPSKQLQDLLASGLLSDLLDANVALVDRAKFRELLDLKALPAKKSGKEAKADLSKKLQIPRFRALNDAEVPARLSDTLAKWRRMAAELDYAGPVAWLAPEGFHFKKHAPKSGPCHDQFQYLQNWTLKDEEGEPTKRQLVFWIPRVIPKSNEKTVQEQLALLAEFRQKYGLPEHHLKAFGKASLLSGLILTHYQLTKEKTPLEGQWVRTDTLHSDGNRLLLGGDSGRWLRCVNWYWDDDDRSGRLWVFPLGVELLDPGELES